MRFVGLVAFGAVIATAISARAESTEAQASFDEALRLRDAGETARACVEFRQSHALEPSVGALLNVAECSESDGALVRALEEYRALLALNETTKDPMRRKSVDARAREAMKALLVRTPTLELVIVPAAAALTIEIDGRAYDRTWLGTPRPLDPGRHVVSVSATGFRPLRQELTVAEADKHVLKLELVPVNDGAAPVSSDAGARTIAGWIAGGLGLATAGAGAAMLGLATARASQIEEICGGIAEPPECGRLENAPRANELASEGRALELGGGVVVAVGAAGLVAGAGLLLSTLLDEDTPGGSGLRIVPVGPAGPGAMVTATF